MKPSRFTEEQVIGVLREQEAGAATAEAQVLIEAWRRHFNTVRPHSSLGYLTPAAFAAKVEKQDATSAQATGRIDAVLGASAPRLVAQPSRKGQTKVAIGGQSLK
jgi:hypothetical protein